MKGQRTVSKFNRIADATAAQGKLDAWAANCGIPREDLDQIMAAARLYGNPKASPADQSRARKTLRDYSRKHATLIASILRGR